MVTTLGRRWVNWKMDGYVKGFILASLGWLATGVTLGLGMAVHDAVSPGAANWTWLLLPSHTHVMTVGWVSMMIFGVGYHMIPRFSGVLVWSPRLAWWHLALANLGLLGMATGFWLDRFQEDRWGGLLGAGGTVQAVAMLLFIVNMLVTIWTAGAPRASAVPLGKPLAERLARREAGASPASITAGHTPAQVLAAHPGVLPVFMGFGFGGLADPEHVRTMGSRITLAQAAARHGVDPVALVRALNQAAGIAAGPVPAGLRPLPVHRPAAGVEPCCPECAGHASHPES